MQADHLQIIFARIANGAFRRVGEQKGRAIGANQRKYG
jgi:hypothetical protein